MYNINNVREDFPILSREVYGKPLVYLFSGESVESFTSGQKDFKSG